MTDQGTDEEVELLPQGLARRYASYTPAADLQPVRRPVHVAGYDDLAKLLLDAGVSVTRDPQDLGTLDAFIMSNVEVFRADERLTRQIGMFYGDVLTHTIPGSYWRVVQDKYPEVVVGDGLAVSVIRVAESLVATSGGPDLAANFDHVRGLAERA